MTIKILAPDEAAKKARERVAEWKRQREMDAAKPRLQARRAKPVSDRISKSIKSKKPRPGATEQSELNSQLIFAIGNGDTDKMKELINRGADVNAMNSIGHTALMLTTWNGQTEAAEILIDGGASIKSRDDEGNTVLMNAAMCGRNETVEMLIRRRAEINVKNKKGMTALMWAIERGYSETADLLRKYGATE